MNRTEYVNYVGGKLRDPVFWIASALLATGIVLAVSATGTARRVGFYLTIAGVILLLVVTLIANDRYRRGP